MDEYKLEVNKKRYKYNLAIKILIFFSFTFMCISLIFNDIFYVAISYTFLILGIIVNIMKGDVERVFSVSFILNKITKLEDEMKKLKKIIQG